MLPVTSMRDCVAAIYYSKDNEELLRNILELISTLPYVPDVNANIDMIVSLSKIVTAYPDDLEIAKPTLIFAATEFLGLGHPQPVMGVIVPAGNAAPRRLHF